MTLSDMSARSRDPSLNSPNVQKAEIHKSASSLTSLCVFAYSTRHETRPRDRSRGKLEVYIGSTSSAFYISPSSFPFLSHTISYKQAIEYLLTHYSQPLQLPTQQQLLQQCPVEVKVERVSPALRYDPSPSIADPSASLVFQVSEREVPSVTGRCCVTTSRESPSPPFVVSLVEEVSSVSRD
jgi:hypothetical protein